MSEDASYQQQQLVAQISSVHEDLRRKYRKCLTRDVVEVEGGVVTPTSSSEQDRKWECLWKEHTENEDSLQNYAKAMFELATRIWDDRNSGGCDRQEGSRIRCRIEWVALRCQEYFKNDLGNGRKLRLLDVGSCYNPFSKYVHLFDIIALDLQPAEGFKDIVYKNDFLKLEITAQPRNKIIETEINQLSPYRRLINVPEAHFQVVVFSFVLEYLPNPRQRIECCLKAKRLLKPGGLMFILRPDSNSATPEKCKWLKKWKVGLGLIGLKRIFVEKLEHLWCTAYVKLDNEETLKQFIESPRFLRDMEKVGHIRKAASDINELFGLPQDPTRNDEHNQEIEKVDTSKLQDQLDEVDSSLFNELPFVK